MTLQFSTFNDLVVDLQAKGGIEKVSDTLPGNSFSTSYAEFYDLPVLKKVIDKDGTVRYVNASQQIVKDLSDESFGYGNNRTWDLQDYSATSFEDEVNNYANNFEGVSLGTSTIVKVSIERVISARNMALVTAYLDNFTTIKATLYKDGNDNWQQLIYS